MKHQVMPKRSFLFLQGPPGPFFWMLGEELRKRGSSVHRINLNGGDRNDWPGNGVNYRGRLTNWSLFVDRYMCEHRITDVILFGDCRPMHMAAHGMAKLRKINVHVFEEGYVRPNWMTLEPNGVNGHSTLSRDPQWFLDQARSLSPMPELPPITASFRRRARDAYRYYHYTLTGRFHYPFYSAHRPGSILIEGFGWLWKFSRSGVRARRMEETLREIEGAPFFIFPLQLGSDYQIRTHSPFSDMQTAAAYVMESFARNAPPEARLLIKEHPLDCGFFDWRRFVMRKARALGVSDRILHIDGGDLNGLSSRASGMVCVNSTSGTLALTAGTPVIVLGDAIYDVPGVTHQGKLDDFWRAPYRPDPAIYEAFKRVLHARCLVRGGLASQSAIAILVESTIARLFNSPSHALIAREVDAYGYAAGWG